MDFVYSPAELFLLANKLALLGWLILIFLPRRYFALFIVPQYIIPFILSLAYTGFLLPHILTIEGGGFSNLDEFKRLFSNEWIMLGGWVHYLAFDLFIGAWLARQMDSLGITRLCQPLILLFTFLAGPLGLASFLVMRLFYRETQDVQND